MRETDSRRREKLSRRKPPKFNLFYSCTSVNLEHIYIFYVKFSLSRINSKVVHDVFPILCSVTNCWMVSLGQQKWLVSLFVFWSNFAVVTTNSWKSLFYADTEIFCLFIVILSRLDDLLYSSLNLSSPIGINFLFENILYSYCFSCVCLLVLVRVCCWKILNFIYLKYSWRTSSLCIEFFTDSSYRLRHWKAFTVFTSDAVKFHLLIFQAVEVNLSVLC